MIIKKKPFQFKHGTTTLRLCLPERIYLCPSLPAGEERPSKRKVAEKKRAEKEAEKKMKHEEAKAANFLKILENCSPGAVLHVGRQVIFLFISMLFVLLFPDLMRCRSRKLR